MSCACLLHRQEAKRCETWTAKSNVLGLSGPYFTSRSLKEYCGKNTKPEGEEVLNDRYCTCGKVYESRKDRDQHVSTNRAEGTHGAFVDELSFLGGAYAWMDTDNGAVLEAISFRLPTRSRAEDNSTREESATIVQATVALRRLI